MYRFKISNLRYTTITRKHGYQYVNVVGTYEATAQRVRCEKKSISPSGTVQYHPLFIIKQSNVCDELGLFALHDMLADDNGEYHNFTLNYIGILELRDNKCKRVNKSRYVLPLIDDHVTTDELIHSNIPCYDSICETIDIDAAKYGNESRFVNCARGPNNFTSHKQPGTILKPNVAYSELSTSSGMYITVNQLCDIRAGDEILVDYGIDYWESLRHNQSIDEENRMKRLHAKLLRDQLELQSFQPDTADHDKDNNNKT